MTRKWLAKAWWLRSTMILSKRSRKSRNLYSSYNALRSLKGLIVLRN